MKANALTVWLIHSSKNNGNHSLAAEVEGGKGSGPVGLLEPALAAERVCPTRAVSVQLGLRASQRAPRARAAVSAVSPIRPQPRPGSKQGLGLGDQQIGAAKTYGEWLIILEPWVDILQE